MNFDNINVGNILFFSLFTAETFYDFDKRSRLYNTTSTTLTSFSESLMTQNEFFLWISQYTMETKTVLSSQSPQCSSSN